MRPARAQARFDLAVIGFQMSSETHARAANAAAAAAREKGWTVTVLNSEGSLPKHAEQFAALIQRKPGAIIVCMGKPTEADAQFEAAKQAGIPVVTVMSGTSPHALFDITVNEYQVGAQAALWLLGRMNFRGGLLTERFEGQHQHAHPRQGAGRGVVGEPGGERRRQSRDGAHRELAGRRAQRHAGAAAAQSRQVPGHLGVLRRAGLRDRRPAADPGHEEGAMCR